MMKPDSGPVFLPAPLPDSVDDELDVILQKVLDLESKATRLIPPRGVSWQKERREMVTRGMSVSREVIKNHTQTAITTALQELESKLPSKQRMIAAINTHSDAGAGHVIGFNAAIDQVKALIQEAMGNDLLTEGSKPGAGHSEAPK